MKRPRFDRRMGALLTTVVCAAAVSIAPSLPASAATRPAFSPTAFSPTAFSATDSSATDFSATAGDTSSDLYAAMRRDLGLSAGQVRARLAVEAGAPYVERRLRTELGTAFGGAWLAADATSLIVGVTDPVQAARITAAGARPAVVARSEGDLARAKAALDATAAGTTIHAWYVDPASNSVVVQADSTADGTRFVRTSGAPTAAVRVSAAPAYRPVYDIRGGDQYTINGNVLCSVGFAVAGGFVTAGHCGGVGSTTSGSGSANGVAQGTFRGSSFPDNDYAWVQTNGNWTAQPVVNNYSGGTASVAGSNEAAVGSSVCRSGRTTGWRCGTIQGKNVTVNYSGQLVYGLTSTSACAQPGDSGGSFISGDQAQGVTSGAGGDCASGGTTVFQPVNEILSVYGLSLTTTGSSTSRIIGYNNKCIDVPNSNGSDGVPLQIWTCNGTNAQNWTFTGGTIRAFGLCMDVAWGSTANGAVIQLANCSGNPAQQFVLSGAGDLVNPQANKCVDVKDWNGNDGGRLQLWDCAGTANQKWRRA